MNTYVTSVIAPGMFSASELSGVKAETSLSVQAQPETRPDIVAVICHSLDGEKLKDALFIADNIRENKMKIKWSSINTWSVKYKGKHVCDLRIENGSLRIGQISDILATRVKYMTSDFERMKRLVDTLRNATTDKHAASYAMS